MRVRLNVHECDICRKVFTVTYKYVEVNGCWSLILGWLCPECGVAWNPQTSSGLERETNIPDGVVFIWDEVGV